MRGCSVLVGASKGGVADDGVQERHPHVHAILHLPVGAGSEQQEDLKKSKGSDLK